MSVKYVNCHVCRGYALESQWCGNCNKTGMVIEKTQANRLAFLENCKKQRQNVEAWPAWKRDCMPITPIAN